MRDAAAGALVSASNALVRASNALVRAHQEELVHAHQKGSRDTSYVRAHQNAQKGFRAAHHNRTTYRCAHHGGVGASEGDPKCNVLPARFARFVPTVTDNSRPANGHTMVMMRWGKDSMYL